MTTSLGLEKNYFPLRRTLIPGKLNRRKNKANPKQISQLIKVAKNRKNTGIKGAGVRQSEEAKTSTGYVFIQFNAVTRLACRRRQKKLSWKVFCILITPLWPGFFFFFFFGRGRINEWNYTWKSIRLSRKSLRFTTLKIKRINHSLNWILLIEIETIWVNEKLTCLYRTNRTPGFSGSFSSDYLNSQFIYTKLYSFIVTFTNIFYI